MRLFRIEHEEYMHVFRISRALASSPGSWGLGRRLSRGDLLTSVASHNADLSYVQGSAQPPLLQESIGANLRRTAMTYFDRPALVSTYQQVRLSYGQFWEQTSTVARGLLSQGVQPGDRVGIWAANSAEWALLQFAAARVGAILVKLNPALLGAELQFALAKTRVSLLVLGQEFKCDSMVETLLSLDGQLPHLHQRVVIGSDVPPGWMAWGQLLANGAAPHLGSELDRREHAVDCHDAAAIQFTSGTTGRPKAAVLSHHNILNNGHLVGHTLRYGPTDKIVIAPPLFHCFGSVMGNLAAITHGAAMVYPAPWFDAEATLQAVHAERCTSLYGVPTMFISLLQHGNLRRYRLDSLRTGIMAGSPCPIEVMRSTQDDLHMKQVSICFGMTESSPVSFQTAVDDPVKRRIATVGRIHPHLEAIVADPTTGQILPRGTVGEIRVRGYSVMLGYWGDEAATAQAIDSNGWLHTGDLGSFDAQGYCSIAGRLKDIVIRGGENLSCVEIENSLHAHPAIRDVQVFGVPDDKYGEELCAWVTLREGNEGVTEQSLQAWCTGRISRHKVPRYFSIRLAPFPMTASGKPQKHLMRKMAADELGLSAAEPGAAGID